MLSGLLITIDILVCIALIAIVLMQRSEGGAFGMGGGPTGLITARGAGDLLTRTTWILFGLFLALSLGLTLLGAHDRATSSVLQKLKLQTANPAQLSQPAPVTNSALPLTAPAPTSAPINPLSGSFLAPQPQPAQSPPLSAPAPQSITTPPAAKPKPVHAAAKSPAAEPAPPVLEPPPPAPAAPASTTP